MNLPALTENTTWSQGDYNHSLYMVKDDQVTHYELSTLPNYTAAGDTAARNGNIEADSSTAFTDEQSIDRWMAAPFHALGMMDPRLTSTGFGSYRESKSGWDAGFTLDVLRGNSFTGGAYPVFFPGAGSSEPLTTYAGDESPDPLQACPGYAAPTGLPVFVEVGGNVSTTVGAHSFTGNGTALAHCVIDSTNSSVGSDLKDRGAVILVPQQPLKAGVVYRVALTVNGVPYTWSFGVTSDNTITAPAACQVTLLSLPAAETSTEFGVSASATGCSAGGFDIQQFDSTLNQGWFGLTASTPAAGSAVALADGYRGHTYQFRARAHSASGLVGAWSATVATAVSPTATLSHPFNGMYTLDAFGGVDSDGSPPVSTTAYWSGWNIARAAHFQPGANAPQSGFVLDGWGGLHPYGAPGLAETAGGSGHSWSGWDIARDFAFLPDGTGGFVLDGWGGLHPFRVNGSKAPLVAEGNAFWRGWDIARKVVIFADGTGGYTLDGWGGIHPFGINGTVPAAASNVAQSGYWPNWNIARDIVLVPGNGNRSGYVLDGWGGVHPFHPSGDGSTMPAVFTTAYWSGWDIARGMWLLPGSATAGYTLDGWGGLHPFGGAPALSGTPFWQGRDVARSVFGA